MTADSVTTDSVTTDRMISESNEGTHEEDLLLEHQLCFGLTVAARSVVAAYRPVLHSLNLTHPQYLVMLALWEEHPRSVGSLGAALAMDSATISPMLKRLEAAGLLTRRRVPGNERAVAVDLTDRGRALRRKALEVPNAIRRRLDLTREQVGELNTAMRAIIAATARAAEQDGDA